MRYKKLKIKYENIISILFTCLFYIQISAFNQGDSPMSSELIRNNLRVFQYSGLIIIILFTLKKYFINKKRILILISFVLFIIIPIFNTYSNNIGGLITFLSLILFFLSRDRIQYKSFIYCKNIWFILSIIGIICFSAYIFSFPIPYSIKDYYFGENLFYIDYKTCFLYKTPFNIRLCGINNEPGYFGTISALFLCSDGINLKNKKNIIIFIAGCLTVSLAYFMLLILYILIINLKNKKIICLILVGIFIYIFIIPNIKTGVYGIDLILERIQISDGKLNGDNRSNEVTDLILTNMLNSHPFWGFGGGYISSKTIGILTYKSYLIDYGIIGFILMYGSLFFSAIYGYWNRNLKNMAYILVFFISVYQRPHIFNLSYMLLLFGGLVYLNNIKINKFRKSICKIRRRYESK